MKKILLLSFSLLLLTISLKSEERKAEDVAFHIGLFGSYSFNSHYPDFKYLEGMPSCCPNFQNGSGNGFAFGAQLEIPLIESISVGARIGVNDFSGLLTDNEDNVFTGVIDLNNPGTVIDKNVKIKHEIDANIVALGLEPYLMFNLFDNFNMTMGMNFGYMVNGRVSMQEKLIEPNNYVFEDGRAIRNDDFQDVDIPSKNTLLLHAVFSGNYKLPIGNQSWLVPEIKYYLPLNDVNSQEWMLSSLHLGASVQLPIFKAKDRIKVRDEIFKRDTVIIEDPGIKEEKIVLADSRKEVSEFVTDDKEVHLTEYFETFNKYVPKSLAISAKVDAYGIDNANNKVDTPKLIIEEVETEESFPILSYVYFKEKDSDLKNTAMNLLDKNSIKEFNEADLSWKTLKIYEDMLNIVASRMINKRSSKIQVIGKFDKASEKTIAKQRAENVADYLTTVWGINKSRIKVTSKKSTEIPKQNDNVDVYEEAKRVELVSSDISLFAPIELKDIQKFSNPPIIEFALDQSAEGEIKTKELSISKLENGEYANILSQDISNESTWRWTVDPEIISGTAETLKVEYEVADQYNNSAKAVEETKIEQLTIQRKREEYKDDKKIEKFSLILFEYNSARLSKAQKEVIKKINKSIKANSKVKIYGYTDRTGDLEYNKELAEKRAIEVRKALNLKDENVEIIPVASEVLLYDNNTPQGRAYCRTVQIYIETPITE